MNETDGSITPEITEADDTALSEEIASLVDRLRRGERIDPEDLDGPYGDKLRLLLPTIWMMSDLTVPEPQDVDLGTLDDFRILREAGRGGMGVVYEAEQISLGRRVALKVLLNAAAIDPRHVRRFQVEAQAAAGLHHPGIVPVFATGAEDGIRFYAMRFIEGQDLARVIQGWKREPSRTSGSTRDRLRTAAELGRQAAEALAYAHAQDVLHRDIKPSNLLVDQAGHLWIADFGLARIQSALDLTRTGDQLGTPRYMSPEQALGRGAAVDERTDVYSLGATLYELLTLRPPFLGENRVGLLRQIAEDDPTPPRRLDPRISTDLETIVLKAMARDPADRYTTAAEMAADLQRFLDDRPILARRPTLADRAGKWVRRHRALAAVTVGVLLVATAVVAVGTWRYNVWLRGHNDSLRAHVARADQEARRAVRAEQRTAAALAETRQQRRVIERHLHVSGLRQVQQAIALGRVDEAQEILDSIGGSPNAPDPRGFAWHYLWRQARHEVTLLARNPSGIFSLTLSPDGRVLTTGDGEGTIVFSDTASGQVLARWTGHEGPVQYLAYSPDGSLVASVAAYGTDRCEVWVRETRTGRRVAGLDNFGIRDIFDLEFIPSGRRLMTAWYDKAGGSVRVQLFDLQNSPGRAVLLREEATDFRYSKALNATHLAAVRLHGTLTLFDIDTLRPLWSASGRDASLGWPAFSPDGRLFAAEDGREAVVREVATGQERARVDIEVPSHEVDRLILGPDGTRLFVAYNPPKLCLFDLTGDRPVPPRDISATLPEQHRVERWVFSPDGRTLAVTTKLASGGPGPLMVWESSTGRPLGTCPGLKRQNYQAVFSQDGRSLFLNGGTSVQRWWLERPEDDPPDALAGHADEAWAVAYSPDGRLLATGSDDTEDDDTLKLWDPATGRILRGWRTGEGTVAALAFSPNGRTLATGALCRAGNLKLWDVATGRLLATLVGHTDQVRTVAYSPDGRLLASAGADRTIRLWNASNGHLLKTLVGHSEPVRSIAFSRDGRVLASVSNDRTMKFWDVSTGEVIRTIGGREKSTALAFSPDGSVLASADQGGIITLRDAKTAKLIKSIHADISELIALAYSPDGRSVAAAGAGRTIRIWDVLTGQELLTLEGHAAQVNGLAFSPSGSTLASTSHDGAVRIWRGRKP